MNAPSQPAQRPNTTAEGYDLNHIVGRWQTAKWRVFRVFGVVPRALCGTPMTYDLAQPQPSPASPFCPACLARNDDSTEGLVWVPAHLT
ncbi:hypothetical protein [Nocardia cyriacigeorgica]|uniref:hypothetical protein n=1 Tax=Nocardia cyriacigeorgica TaxID=135487 RepID=UPI002454DA81|nr:hypothetical protein [Nocardia cyriacigeorgica]